MDADGSVPADPDGGGAPVERVVLALAGLILGPLAAALAEGLSRLPEEEGAARFDVGAAFAPLRRRPLRTFLWVLGLILAGIWLGGRGDLPAGIRRLLHVALLGVVAEMDLRTRLIATPLAWAGILLALIPAPLGALTGALTGGGLFLGLFLLGRLLFGPGALGLGDVYLAAYLGALAARPADALLLLTAGMFLGGAFALVQILRRARTMPYAPPLCLAGILWVLLGLGG